MISQSDVNEFMLITGANEGIARNLLAKNVLEVAINRYFENPELYSSNQTESRPEVPKTATNANSFSSLMSSSEPLRNLSSLIPNWVSMASQLNSNPINSSIPTTGSFIQDQEMKELIGHFRAITNESEDVAKKYLNRANKLEVAFEIYFRDKEHPPPENKISRFISPARNFTQNLSEESNNFDDDDEDGDDGSDGDLEDSFESNSDHPRPYVPITSPADFMRSLNSFQPINNRRRKKRRERHIRTKLPPIDICEEDLDIKEKKDYYDYIKPYYKDSKSINTQNKNKIWPKFLGTLVGNCQLTELNYIKKGDRITFEPSDIDFSCSNTTRKKTTTDSNGKKTVHTFTKKTWSIKATTLHVQVLSKGRRIGYLSCEHEELFVFLLARKYIILDGVILTNYDKKSEDNFVRIQMDIFLTDNVIKNPMRYVAKVGRRAPKGIPKNMEIEEDEESEDAQKQHQLLRLTREAFYKLFNYLKLKVGEATVVQIRQKQDPFERIINEKKKKNGSIQGPTPVLYTGLFTRYYREADVTRKLLIPASSKTIHIGSSSDEDLEFDYDIEETKSQNAIVIDPEREDKSIITGQNSNHFNQSEAPETFKSDLHPYQKQALHWMRYREECFNEVDLYTKEAPKRRELHDLFQELILIDDSKIYFNPFNGEITDLFPRSRLCRGGILADEMGLGKTVMAIALIHSHRRKVPQNDSTKIVLKKTSKIEDDADSKPVSKKVKKNPDHSSSLSGKEVQRSNTLPQKQTSLSKFITKYSSIDNEDKTIFIPKSEIIEPEVITVEESTDSKKKDSDDDFLSMGFGNSMKNFKQSLKRKRTNSSKDDLEQEFIAEDTQSLISQKPISKPPLKVSEFYDDDVLSAAQKFEESTAITIESSEKSIQKPKRRIIKKSKTTEDDEFDFGKDGEDESKFDEWEPEKELKKSKTQKDPKKSSIIVRKDSFEGLGFGSSDRSKAGTLIIVPLTVLSQWVSEFENHSKENTLTVLQYYGHNRSKQVLSDYDVVITTYGILEAECDKNKEGIFDYEWFRVILDEAHQIKSRITKTSKAAYSIKSEYRWCMTGTPLQNKLDDLFSILKFLRVEIWGDYVWWNTYINKGISQTESTQIVRGILGPIFLRRTKSSTYIDGRNILHLPGKTIQTCFVDMTKEEKSIYNALFHKGQDQFNEIVTGGMLQYEYAHIFELLVKLRQVCDHPALVFSRDDMRDAQSLENAVLKFIQKKEASVVFGNKKDSENSQSAKGIQSEFVQKTIESLKKKELEPCAVCLEEILIPVVTKCCHVFCRPCMKKAYELYKRCPFCNEELGAGDFLTVEDEANPTEQSNLLDMKSSGFKMSSKAAKVVEHIKLIQEKGEKVVIFSQFIKMLNIVEKFIKEEGIYYKRIDGSCTLKARTNSIDEFKSDPNVTVILISLKAGATGLNLTAARHVFLIDPWWNPAIEDQAIERVHRIGQLYHVNVIRFICRKTIEERILQLNEKKKALISLTLNYNPAEQKKENLENMIYVMKGFDDEDEDNEL